MIELSFYWFIALVPKGSLTRPWESGKAYLKSSSKMSLLLWPSCFRANLKFLMSWRSKEEEEINNRSLEGSNFKHTHCSFSSNNHQTKLSSSLIELLHTSYFIQWSREASLAKQTWKIIHPNTTLWKWLDLISEKSQLHCPHTHLARYIQAVRVFPSTGGSAHLLHPTDGPQRDVQDHHHVLQPEAGEQSLCSCSVFLLHN